MSWPIFPRSFLLVTGFLLQTFPVVLGQGSPAAKAVGEVRFPGREPGASTVSRSGDTIVLENQVLSATWTVSSGRLAPKSFTDKLSGTRLDLSSAPCFVLELVGGQRITSSDLKLLSKPQVKRVPGRAGATRLADRFSGQSLEARLQTADGNLTVTWTALLLDGSNYLRQIIALENRTPTEISRIILQELPVEGAQVLGTVRGSPVVARNEFFGLEDPMSESEVVSLGGRQTIRCSLPYHMAPPAGVAVTYSSVIGVTPAGQLRRGFLYYLERERAQPYRTFLHHNNGEDIGMNYWNLRKKDEAGAARYRLNQEKMWTDMIDGFARELIKSRGVVLDSFVHDFDWDDEKLVWLFHEGYPKGFTRVRDLVKGLGSSVGIWFSPWGGYPEKADHIKYGQAMGFETNSNGLSLAGPRYYSRFRLACLDMLKQADVNYFKFDGEGPGNNASGPGIYMSDMEALNRLIAELRSIKPDVFINVSTGSWPSPFWLQHADVIWRAGSDTGLEGRGSERQKWVTYRDANTYNWTVKRGPLYPISSLMIHGIMFNTGGRVTSFETSDLIEEIRSFFGTGTSLQELYIAPSLMKKEGWDALADAAKWSRSNADVLADTHWIGGDPAKYEVYGWASWSTRKGILALRNPDQVPKTAEIDIAKAFELPAGAPVAYQLKSAWADDRAKPGIDVRAGQPHRFELKPFEVLVFDAIPLS